MALPMTGDRIAALTEGLISAKKQRGPFSLDLTVRCISRVGSGGAVDFGGTEHRPASATVLTPEKISPEEPYGWWRLGPGKYLVGFNEKTRFHDETAVIIFPHMRIVSAGASHAPVIVENIDWDVLVLLEVAEGGVAIKENARISRAMAFGHWEHAAE